MLRALALLYLLLGVADTLINHEQLRWSAAAGVEHNRRRIEREGAKDHPLLRRIDALAVSPRFALTFMVLLNLVGWLPGYLIAGYLAGKRDR